jgi:hypothetical protein
VSTSPVGSATSILGRETGVAEGKRPVVAAGSARAGTDIDEGNVRPRSSQPYATRRALIGLH